MMTANEGNWGAALNRQFAAPRINSFSPISSSGPYAGGYQGGGFGGPMAPSQRNFWE
jgi:hypothetical protein